MLPDFKLITFQFLVDEVRFPLGKKSHSYYALLVCEEDPRLLFWTENDSDFNIQTQQRLV